MDIATIIISAIGGIFIWNIFFSKGKNGSVCEAAAKPDLWLVKSALVNSFGTTDIPAALEISKKYPDPTPDPWLVKSALINTFGTTNLDFIFENYLSKENREKLQQQILQR